MYRRVSWMKAADQAILQLLGEPKQLELTTGNISRNTGLDRSYTSKRLKELRSRGLVESDDDSGHPFYSITEKGQSLLDGEIEPESLNEDDDTS